MKSPLTGDETGSVSIEGAFMASRARVLAVTHTLQYDGAPQSMLQIARALSHEGFKIMLLSGRQGPLLRGYEEIGAMVVSPQLPFIPTEVWNPYYPSPRKSGTRITPRRTHNISQISLL